MPDRTVALSLHAEAAIHLPCKGRVKSRFGRQIVWRGSREQLGSLLSNGGTSFPTALHNAREFGQCERCIALYVTNFT
jgi:hypothetical protein